MQFAELNRLRRLEPSQWTVCQTCRRRFDYSVVQMYGGVVGNLVSGALDNLASVRIAALVALSLLGYLLRVGSLAMRVLTSTAFWQLVSSRGPSSQHDQCSTRAGPGWCTCLWYSSSGLGSSSSTT